MGFELERVLYETEDFLRRHMLRAGSAREARKRRFQRKMQEVLRRLQRAGFILGGLLAGLVVVSIFLRIGFVTWVVALPTVFLLAFLSLFWPTRRRAVRSPAGAPLPLDELAVRVEEGLMDRGDELPGRALPAADAIIAKLHELQPHLGTLDPQSMLAGDARRLISEHLPKLVDTYLDLPRSARAPNAESTQRFTESLGIVAQELDHLLDQCCRDRQLNFETQRRFIETRYREDPSLKGD